MCARARGSVPEFWFVSFVLKLVICFMNISTNNEGRHHFHSIKLLCALCVYSFNPFIKDVLYIVNLCSGCVYIASTYLSRTCFIASN